MRSQPPDPANRAWPKGACSIIVATMLGLTAAAKANDDGRAIATRLVVQDSPLAGFRYHEAPAMFASLREGDQLDLVREPANPHDHAAIRVEWRGHMLGYVPRAQNQALAWALDRGERMRARVSRLLDHPNPRERVRFEVLVE